MDALYITILSPKEVSYNFGDIRKDGFRNMIHRKGIRRNGQEIGVYHNGLNC